MAKRTPKIEKAVAALWKKPSEENWKAFAKAMPRSGLRYYRVFYGGDKLKRAQDLKKYYAELYDTKQRLVTKIPIYKTANEKISGATYYMKGLLTINKITEWIK